MKSPVKLFFWLPAVTITAVFSLLLSGCQKAPTPETAEAVQSNAQNVPVSSNINQDAATPESPSQNIEANTPSTAMMTDSNDNANNNADNSANVNPNPETMPLSQQPTKGTQVTDVHYRSDSGETLSVVFETSATGTLNAIITLASDSKITLSAPEGQGNNPTYHSADGKMELVSHEGGTVIDLIRDDKMISFTAISAEAEVITQV